MMHRIEGGTNCEQEEPTRTVYTDMDKGKGKRKYMLGYIMRLVTQHTKFNLQWK